MKILLIAILAAATMSSCTISISNCDTHGYANDLVDETSTTSPDIQATANVPISPI
jgi:hypothetical protein